MFIDRETDIEIETLCIARRGAALGSSLRSLSRPQEALVTLVQGTGSLKLFVERSTERPSCVTKSCYFWIFGIFAKISPFFFFRFSDLLIWEWTGKPGEPRGIENKIEIEFDVFRSGGPLGHHHHF